MTRNQNVKSIHLHSSHYLHTSQMKAQQLFFALLLLSFNLEIISKVKLKCSLICTTHRQLLSPNCVRWFETNGKTGAIAGNAKGDKCVIYPSTSRLIDKIITRLREAEKASGKGEYTHLGVCCWDGGRKLVEHVFWRGIHYAAAVFVFFVVFLGMSSDMGELWHGKLQLGYFYFFSL